MKNQGQRLGMATFTSLVFSFGQEGPEGLRAFV